VKKGRVKAVKRHTDWRRSGGRTGAGAGGRERRWRYKRMRAERMVARTCHWGVGGEVRGG
jgi:hypothetical protein